MSDNVAKQMKGVERKQPSRRRHLSLARADIVRHKSGIVIAWFDNVRLRRGAKIKSKQLVCACAGAGLTFRIAPVNIHSKLHFRLNSITFFD